jgi:UDP-3-O-[3-hydroxymyristoyl] glucosamine N-acyltransferase
MKVSDVMNVKEEMDYILESFLNAIPAHLPVCSLAHPKSNSVTFLRNTKYFHYLYQIEKLGLSNLIVITQESLDLPDLEGVSYYRTADVDILFTLYANFVHKGNLVDNEIHSSAVIDSSAVIGAEGISAADYKNERIFFRHHGNVKIGEGVYVGANAVVQRGRIDSTVIGSRTIISSLCVVGHNTVIGENCSMAIQSGISGTCKIGNRCFIGIGAKVRDSVSICDDVVIGIGAVVIRDIDRPGVYAGNPARFLREQW